MCIIDICLYILVDTDNILEIIAILLSIYFVYFSYTLYLYAAITLFE